jgi:alkylation response protein AidB-like acyl-CoA dehydrogenase
MHFGWSTEQARLYEQLWKGAQALPTASDDTSTAPGLNREVWRRCGALGLLGLPVPASYGGQGADALTTAYAIEAAGRGCEDMGLIFSVCAHLFACVMPILTHAGEEVRDRMLPLLCSGKWRGANAITELEAGSDVFSLSTRADRDGDEYVLSGTKAYVTNGPDADVFLVYATVDPALGFLGVTAFLVERGTPGLEPTAEFNKVGLRSAAASGLVLKQCRVPARNRLGEEGEGGQVFQQSMRWERACLFAAYVGAMERQLERTIRFAKERRQFGRPIGKNQAVSHRIVNMRLRLEAARLLLYQACWKMDQGEEATLDGCLSKLAISEGAVQSGLDAVQLHGAIGIDTDRGIERMLRDALPSTIFSGSSEILRDIIARELGL